MYKQTYRYELLFSACDFCDNPRLSIFRVVIRFTAAYSRGDKGKRKETAATQVMYIEGYVRISTYFYYHKQPLSRG